METGLPYLIAADLLLLAHTLFVVFVVAGLVLILFGKLAHWDWVRNPWFRLAHLLAIGVVVLQAWLGRVCPLTIWEMALRERAGDVTYEGSFIAHWLESLLYYNAQAWVFTVAYTAFGLLVVLSWFQVRPRPFQWRVRRQRIIAASADDVWRAISTPGNLEPCHPFCASNPVKQWPGRDSVDEVHYLSGWMYQRRFVDWHEGIGYDLAIGRPGGGQSEVSWRITPIDDSSAKLSITVCPHVLQEWPAVVRWIPYLFRVRPLLGRYLDSVVGGFEWYITKGEAVPRNAFGTHPWFSARDPAS
jgi:hypothetical protein